MASNKQIRVALVVRPAAGGIRKHVATLLTHLDRERFAPTLFAPADFADLAAQTATLHVPLDIPPRHSLLKDGRLRSELVQILNGNFDIIHAHGLRAAWITARVWNGIHLPYVFTTHNLVPSLNPLSRFGFRFACLAAAQIIAVSEAVAITITENNIPKGKIVVIPNGVEIEPFDAPFDAEAFRASLGLAPKTPLVVAAGRLAPEKGFDFLIRAFHGVKAECQDAQLLLIGGGPEREEIIALTGEDPAMRLTGFVPDVTPYLRIATVVAVPSREEGQGIVALEAMAARKPVVASRVGGLIETIQEDVTGLLVPPDVSRPWIDALIALLSHPARSEAMGQEGRRRVEKHYVASAIVRRIEAVYEEVATP